MRTRGNISITLIALFCSFIFALGCTSVDKSSIYDLKCENLKNPLGINTLKPRFSWKNIVGEVGSSQSAYQILVAYGEEKLQEGEANCWNSGKISSNSNILIEYTGEPLAPGQLLYWKVRTWDQDGNPSAWSETAKFSIGLLQPQDWKASYIGYTSQNRFRSCPQFLKTFSVNNEKKDQSYLLHVNSLGYHEVYFNGKKINEDVLSPAVSQFDKRSLGVTYDVTSLIGRGENNIVLWLGSGWYNEGFPGVIGDGPLAKAQLERVNGVEKEVVLVTDESWSGRESEYTRFANWKSGNYGGEVISGNLEKRDQVFTSPRELVWDKATVVEVPVHEVTPQMVECNRIMKTFVPIEVQPYGEKAFLVDMGTTLTGWFEIDFQKLTESQEVVLEYSDHLDNNGQLVNQNQIDHYIASGSGKEVFKNKFNYHGFRYVKISNLDAAPQLSSMKAHLIHTDFEITSKFECSDPELNRIHDMIFYTLQCLSLGGYLVDCPQLERLGYGGDGNASTVTAQTMFNLAPLYTNWLQAWGDVIKEDGSMPHVAPTPHSAGGGPYWCGFIISASWNYYQRYGDIRILEKYYPVMQKWLGYVEKYSIDGLLKRWPDTEYRNWYLGDWATPSGVGDPNSGDIRSVDLVNNCYISVCFSQMQDIAKTLNKLEDVKLYAEKKKVLNKTIHETFYDAEKGYYSTGSQIDIAFPILAGVPSADICESLTNVMIERTEKNYNGHLDAGLVGIPVLMEWASKVIQPDFIYSMLKKKTFPGYLYMLESGGITTWEHWGGQRSRIHNCYNGVGEWFYQVVGGIRSIPGKVAYCEFVVDPQIPKGVNWAKTSFESPRGMISVNWQVSEGNMKTEVQVPNGSICQFVMPNNATKVVVNNKPIMELEILELPSGKHIVEYVLE